MGQYAAMRRVCIVTPGYISCTPRVVKEADALAEAGYAVHVVFSQGDIERAREHDAVLLKEKTWSSSAVRWSRHRVAERFVYWRSTLRYQCARRVPILAWPFVKIAEHGEGRIYSELACEAAAHPADLFIGHYPIGLAAAAYAASVRGVKLGYDAEDLHTAEQPDTPQGRERTERIAYIEEKYLKRCVHVSAVTSGIAQILSDRYGSVQPVVLHNVFPWSDRLQLDTKIKDRRGPDLSLYWFSQTIGLDRGIQDVIRASGELGGPVQIHLRGSLSEPVKTALLTLAGECGVAERLYFHAPVPPTELLSRTVEHDVGLAVDQPVNASRILSVTNKLFLYMIGGLAIAATDVTGQRAVMEASPNIGCLYQPGDYKALAISLEKWRRNPTELENCKNAALAASKDRWSWEIERQKLVNSIDVILSHAQAEIPQYA
jgi:glycosyltransferase involved in cell wall biosynthesis